MPHFLAHCSLFIDAWGSVKLGDFGLAAPLVEGCGRPGGAPPCGTLNYMPAEAVGAHPGAGWSSVAADVW